MRTHVLASLLMFVACGGDLATADEESGAANDQSLSAAPVRVIYYSSVVMHDYYWDQMGAQIDLRVDDAACGGIVVVHLSEDAGPWSDLAATRLSGAGPGFSLYRATISHSGNTPTVRFAVRCNEGAAARWDNNAGKDYGFQPQTGSVMMPGSTVYNAGYSPTLYGLPGQLQGLIALRNLAHTKRVSVVFTTDSWRTTQTFQAKYRTLAYTPGLTNPNALGNETWTFDLPIGGAKRVEYAVAYEVNGQTYWDNNFGQNYVSVAQ